MKSENQNSIRGKSLKTLQIPKQIIVSTADYIKLQTKLNLLVALYGCQLLDTYLDNLPLRIHKRDGKLLGAYIENKICQEYKITRYDLAEGYPTTEVKEARQIACYLCEKYLDLNRSVISSHFHKTRHFAKRLIKDFEQKLEENHPFDKKMIERYRRLDVLISSYVDFKPIIKNEP